MAIHSFSDKSLEVFFESGKTGKGFPWFSLAKIVKRKVDMLHYAAELDDLKAPPGNRLEALKGDLNGFFSIRINDKWRLLFHWTDFGACDVCIRDYH